MNWNEIYEYLVSMGLGDYLIALGIFLVFALAAKIFSRYLIGILIFLASKTKTDLDTKILKAFQGPVSWFIVSLGAYLALRLLLAETIYFEFIHRLFRSMVIVCLTAGFYNLASTSSEFLRDFSKKFDFDRILVAFISRALRFIFVAIAATIVAQEWGYDVNGFLAGLGIGGLAFALAAQDSIANVFGGMVIIVEKPFNIGDWILTPAVEGTVEDITFRSTKVRTFAQALVTVPNSAIANQPITNWSEMGRRRISFKLGVTYSTSANQMRRCVAQIKKMLEQHPDIHPETIFVNFEGFNDSSLDIFIYCFTVTTNWGQYLSVQEDVNLKIMEILAQEGLSVAFPSRSLYLETPLEVKNRGSEKPAQTPYDQ